MGVARSAIGEFPPGRGELLFPSREGQLRIFTWRPAAVGDGPLLVVFHGVLRNAAEYRDHAEALARRLGGALAAPLFDAERFPTTRYQQGGILRKGQPVAERDWTFSLVPPLVDALRESLGGGGRKVHLLGHSGGGQFLARMAAFVSPMVDQIVAANPGTHLFLNREHAFPLGFGGLPAGWGDDAVLERYLAQPLTIYLGTGDIVRDENLDVSPEADRQGLSRYERGRRAWFRGRDLAQQRGWRFAWRLVEAPGIPHDHERMFNHPQCLTALRGA
jgi:pimeloyl-ACP methyl ester carboxylesterase